jgi:AMMECR1 domain-containing protein
MTTKEKISLIKSLIISPINYKSKGVFITFDVNSKLQGCIGTYYDDSDDLISVIIKYTILTVFEDNRGFDYYLRKKENYKNLYLEDSGYEFKINFLSKSEKIQKQDFWKKYVPCLHGIILKKKNKTSTFLPMVMLEQNWISSCKKEINKEKFMKTFESLYNKLGEKYENIFNDASATLEIYPSNEYSDVTSSYDAANYSFDLIS